MTDPQGFVAYVPDGREHPEMDAWAALRGRPILAVYGTLWGASYEAIRCGADVLVLTVMGIPHAALAAELHALSAAGLRLWALDQPTAPVPADAVQTYIATGKMPGVYRQAAP